MEALAAFHLLRPWWLLLIPLWLWLATYVWRQGAKSTGWRAVCDPALLAYLVGEEGDKPAHYTKAVWFALAFGGCAALLALAGPVWKQLPQPLYRAESALVIGLDLSRSMLAADLKPNRLARAKQKLQDILAMRQEGQTALVVFAGAAFDVVPLTSDKRAILAMLESLTPDMMPVQGSRASAALEHAEAILKRAAISQGAVLLLTDGVDAAAMEAATSLAKAGHRVSVLGVGTAAGAPIPAPDGGFLKDAQGQIVMPKLYRERLQKLADRGHGVYRDLRVDDQDIHAIPGLKASITDPVAKQAQLHTDRWQEEGPWLLLLVLPLLSLAFRRGLLLLLLFPLLLTSPDHASAARWQDLWQTPDQQGQALMQAHKPAEAATRFQAPEWQGAALYRAGKYAEAAKAFGEKNSADAWYNRGNALAKAGKLKAAIAAYDQALKLNKEAKDAAFNRKILRDILKKSKPPETKKKGKSGSKGEQKHGKGEQGDGNKKREKSPRSAASKSSENQQQGQHAEHENRELAKPSPRAQKGDKGKSEGLKKGHQARKKAANQLMSQQRKEDAAALQQWLRRIPDDPGGLLRRKFLYQYQQQHPSQSAGEQSW